MEVGLKLKRLDLKIERFSCATASSTIVKPDEGCDAFLKSMKIKKM